VPEFGRAAFTLPPSVLQYELRIGGIWWAMLQNVSAEAIYCHERARQARERADATNVVDAKSDCLAAEERWLALARTYELQRRLSTTLGGNCSFAPMPRSFDPGVVTIINSAFSAVFADLGLSDRDDAVALRVARRIIELAFAGERDPERLRATTLAWVPE
jgi:hypothetical protein